MKRFLIPAGAAALAVLALTVVNATAGRSGSKAAGGGSIHVVEHAVNDAVTNGGPSDAAGNILTFANDVYDAADKHKVGSDQGYCVRIVVGATWECNWTTFLPDGQITVEGPFSDTGDTVLAITGGTGAYRNSRGSMQLHYHNPAGTEFDFEFELIG
jgi:allene oxide cyclase